MAVPCVKNHYERTYFDDFMPTCLRGASFFETQCSRWYIAVALIPSVQFSRSTPLCQLLPKSVQRFRVAPVGHKDLILGPWVITIPPLALRAGGNKLTLSCTGQHFFWSFLKYQFEIWAGIQEIFEKVTLECALIEWCYFSWLSVTLIALLFYTAFHILIQLYFTISGRRKKTII